ncbi:MAG: hypothetical protein JRF38_05020 [Deltaproteobacteria bacterium]|jgi:hypothetical protein|nr:hypothetical protein [Deltaproteobacteria bacterium]
MLIVIPVPDQVRDAGSVIQFSMAAFVSWMPDQAANALRRARRAVPTGSPWQHLTMFTH